MQESRQGSSLITVSSRSSPQVATATGPQRRVVGANRVEVRDLLSRRRELADLVAGARRENAVLRVQLERSAAALEVGGDSSDLSQALRRHADSIRRLHEQMRTNKKRERSTERTLKKKEATLDKLNEEVKRYKRLIDNGDDLPQVDDLRHKLATTANCLSAKDKLIQDLRDYIERLTASHAAVLSDEKLEQREKKRETQRLYAHTDELKLQIKMLDKELSRGLIYSQTAMRHAPGSNVDNLAPTSAQSAPEPVAGTLNLQQKMKQFDAIRREQWQQQIQKELKRRRRADERKRRLEQEAVRLRKMEEERLVMEEKDKEQRKLERAKEEQEQKLQKETERLTREEEDRQKERYRKVLEKQTEELLNSQSRWYYEGSGIDWLEDRQSSSSKLTSDPSLYEELAQCSKQLPLSSIIGHQDTQVKSPRPSCNVKSENAIAVAKTGRRSKQPSKAPAAKCASESGVAGVTDQRDCVFAEVSSENSDMHNNNPG